MKRQKTANKRPRRHDQELMTVGSPEESSLNASEAKGESFQVRYHGQYRSMELLIC